MRVRHALVASLCALLLAATARGQGFVDPCLQCGQLYAGDGAGRLFLIDVEAGTSTLVGTSFTMFDIGITQDGRLIGVDGGGSLHLMDACTGGASFVGGSSGFVNALAGDLFSLDLFGQGPPLRRIDGTTFTSTIVGGSVPGPPPGWCGSSTGDLAMNPNDGFLYSVVFCPSCGSDMLLRVDPSTGDVLAEVGCITEAGTGLPATGVFGLAFDTQCRLLGAQESSSSLLEIDVTTGQYVQRPITGGYAGAFGLASVPCPGPPCVLVADTCEPLTQGFWKRQCRGHHPSGEHELLPDRIACVGATATFGGTASVDEMCSRLHPEPENDKCLQAEAQFMALLLNACSGRLGLSCCIDSPWSDATTVGEAIAEIDGLLSSSGRTFRDCVRAQGLADDINTAAALCDGTVPPPVPPPISPRLGGGPSPAGPAVLRASERARFRR